MKTKAILLNIGTILVSIGLMILLLEWVLRFSGIQKMIDHNPPIYQESSSTTLSYELKKSIQEKAYGATLTTNADGFRTTTGSEEGKPVVAIVGDSVAFGYGVKDSQTIPSNLQAHFPQYRFINAGINGYNIEQEIEQYTKKIAPLNPVATVLMFNFNDMDETLRLDSEGYFVPMSYTENLSYTERLDRSLHAPVSLRIPFKTFLHKHSALFQMIVRSARALRSSSKAPSVFNEYVSQESVKYYNAKLAEFANLLGDTPRMFVIWPEALLHLDVRKSITLAAEQNGFTVLDFYEIYGNSYPSLGWDGHPNASTNAHAASIIADALTEWGIL